MWTVSKDGFTYDFVPLLYGMSWLDFLDQWDPKSPWHDHRVRLAASLTIDRKSINHAEMLMAAGWSHVVLSGRHPGRAD